MPPSPWGAGRAARGNCRSRRVSRDDFPGPARIDEEARGVPAVDAELVHGCAAERRKRSDVQLLGADVLAVRLEERDQGLEGGDGSGDGGGHVGFSMLRYGRRHAALLSYITASTDDVNVDAVDCRRTSDS